VRFYSESWKAIFLGQNVKGQSHDSGGTKKSMLPCRSSDRTQCCRLLRT